MAREVKVNIVGDASSFNKAVGQVEAGTGKMSGALKKIGAGIGIAAIGKGVLSLADNYETAVLSAQNFATASGLTVEQASRLQEATSSLGIDSAALSSSVGKLTKTLGANEAKFKSLGVTVKRNADGTVNSNETLLGAIGVLHDMKDPLARAKLGSDLFGKSWGQLAPLVEMGADGVRTALEGVGDAQVFTDDDVAKAKRFQEQMDNVHDSVDSVKLTLAGALMPALSTFAEWLASLDPKMVTLIATIGGGVLVLGKLGGAVGGVSSLLTTLASHPLIAGAGLVLGGIAFLIANWDKVTAAVDGALRKMQQVGDYVAGPITKVLNFFGADIGKGTTELGPNALAYVGGKKKWTGGHVGGGPVLTGERGPELFWPGGAGRMSNTRDSAAMMGGRPSRSAPYIGSVTVRNDQDMYKLTRDLDRLHTREQKAQGRPAVVPR